MTRRDQNFVAKLRVPKATSRLAVALSAALSASPAVSSGFPTIDNALNAQMAEQITTMRSQLTELTRMKSLIEQQVSSLGEFGTMGDLFSGTALDASSGTETDFYTNMQTFAFDPCAINLCRVGDNPVGTTDLEEATTWAMENFYASVPLDTTQSRDLNEVRRRAVVYSSINGVALANVIHNELAGAGETAGALQSIVESSQSLRGDVRANSAIALMTYEVEIKKLAALTALLGVESSAAMSETSRYHENGGEEFPDALIDADFALNDPDKRIDVTIPERGSPSGGGGFGGGAFAQIAGLAPGGDALVDTLSRQAESIGGLSVPGALDTASLTTGDVLADATSVARRFTESAGQTDISAALSTLERAASTDGLSGKARSLVSAASVEASAAGNTGLGETLRLADALIQSSDADAAAGFARGAVEDLRRQGVQNSYLRYIEDQAAAVSRGNGDARSLVLDTSTMLATFTTGEAGRAADILRRSPDTLDGESLRDLVADTIDRAGRTTGQDELRLVSEGLRQIETAPARAE